MFEDFTPIAVERFGSLVTYWPADKLPNGVSPHCRNVRFTPASVLTREGLTRVFSTSRAARVHGLAGYVQLSGEQIPLVFDALGGQFMESPAASGILLPVGTTLVVPPPGSYMNTASAYNRAYLAFGDNRFGTGTPASFDGANLDPIGLAPPGGASQAGDSAAAGNISPGLRYGVVMFQTRSGYITAPQAPFSWNASGGHQAALSNLPIGPPQVTARIVAFTVAGGSSAGPYFYIGSPHTVNGIAETATIVADNVSTSATFNFDDTFLAASTDVTANFRNLVLPPEAGVWYSPTTRRLLWWGEAEQPSLVRISEPDNPETYYGDTGFALIAEDNGQRVTACFEYKRQLFVAKERSLYLLTPNSGDPATWTAQEISHQVGICGPRAVDVGPEFAAFAHRSGAYVFTGGDPVFISLEIDPLWKRINWTLGHLIWAHIDAEERQLRFGVPLDQSTVPNVILKVDYHEGWEAPVIYSPFTGTTRAYPGRKWSVDDIPAMSALRIERQLPDNGAVPGYAFGALDNELATSQLLFAAAVADGSVSAADPSRWTDNGEPIAAEYQTAFLSSSQGSLGASLGIQTLAGISASLRGAGGLAVEAVPYGRSSQPTLLRALRLDAAAEGDYKIGGRMHSERIAFRFRAQPEPGAHFELQRLFAFMRTAWQSRT
jgi:hypothetical protein